MIREESIQKSQPPLDLSQFYDKMMVFSAELLKISQN